MKRRILTAPAWMAMGLLISLLVLAVLTVGLKQPPRLLVDDAALRAHAQELMESLRSGDYKAVSQLLSGAPDLGQPPRPDTPEGQIWQAYLGSIRYECAQHCGCTGSQVTLEMTLQCLDISSVTEALQETGRALLEARANQIHDESLVYDGDHNYLESFLTPILMDATAQTLEEHGCPMERQLTLIFTQQDGTWKIVPTQELQQLLSGYVCN